MPRRRRSTIRASTFVIIHRRGLLLLPLLGIISIILVAGFVSALPPYPQEAPSLSADAAHTHAQQQQNIRGGGKPIDVKIPCNFNGYNGFFVKRWQCDDRARKGMCFCAAVAVTDPIHSPFLNNAPNNNGNNGNGHHHHILSSPNNLSSEKDRRQDYEECCMQIPCIKDAIYNPAPGRYSCMDTTSIISPQLCYSGQGIYVPNLCPNLPETIQCCTAPPPPPATPRRGDSFQPQPQPQPQPLRLTYNNLDFDFGANNDDDYNTDDFNSFFANY